MTTKRLSLIVVVATVIVLAALGSMSHSQGVPGGERWEHGLLRATGSNATWQAGSDEVIMRGPSERAAFVKKRGGVETQGSATDMLNALSKEGWEVIEANLSVGESSQAESFLLRRRAI